MSKVASDLTDMLEPRMNWKDSLKTSDASKKFTQDEEAYDFDPSPLCHCRFKLQ